MRLVGSKEDDHIWRSKVPTLGPFCLLLWDDPFNTRMKTNIELYRGANLKPEQIAMYEAMAKTKDEYGSFQGFSSCSRNRKKAEEFGNALFIMEVKFAFIADISKVSEYENEEEELITPGVCFRVLKVKFDSETKKHLIHLELRQRWSGKKLSFDIHNSFHQDISRGNLIFSQHEFPCLQSMSKRLSCILQIVILNYCINNNCARIFFKPYGCLTMRVLIQSFGTYYYKVLEMIDFPTLIFFFVQRL
ncbi:unnamed protein product [Adineta ricciae]|uniref:NAD(P)(+)--arginine ADP-ribosyltransferase n=1 Tax=Adineta ricciae TaxID=249248 RepID=A0A815U3S6_ADIRI|nr:unnamed protein product [Adineta ricciae]